MSFEKSNQVSVENMEGNESIDSVYKKGVEAGVENALSLIAERFENREDEKENLPFHDTVHTQEVIDNTEAILNAIGATEKEIVLGKLIASYHDTVQEWEPNILDDGRVMRRRLISENEEASFKEFENHIKEINEQEEREVFSDDDIEMGRVAIMGTIPEFSVEKNTVVQPNITKETPKVARAVALADIGSAGIGGPEVFQRGDSNLFREDNLDILEAMSNPDQITEEDKKDFKERVLRWSKFQPVFANGRKEMFETEIEGFSKEEKEKLRDLFSRFDESIENSNRVAEAREKMTFEEMAKSMGY